MNKNPYADLEHAINSKFRYEELAARPIKKGRGYVKLKDGELVLVREYQDTVGRRFEEFCLLPAYDKWCELIHFAQYRHTITTETNPSRTIALSDIREFIWEDV